MAQKEKRRKKNELKNTKLDEIGRRRKSVALRRLRVWGVAPNKRIERLSTRSQLATIIPNSTKIGIFEEELARKRNCLLI